MKTKHTSIVRILVSTLLGAALLSGCSATGSTNHSTQVAWSHAMSGEYLFAYDQSQCADQSSGDTSNPLFFSCMQSLGYYQIDPATGAPVATLGADLGPVERPTTSASL